MAGGEKQLYFIALVPPPPVFQEVLALKKYVAEIYASRAALNSPPHITLHMPFRMAPAKEGKLIEELEGRLNDIAGFMIRARDFEAFAPRVIYIHIEMSEQLQKLQYRVRKSMQSFLHADHADYKNRGFTPHMTIAFRDLSKKKFGQAWEEFSQKKFSADWYAGALTLLRHSGQNWETHHEISLEVRT